ncbi:MAG: leucine-rich repeat domain-containing protein [Lachnospiraceae bacterium]|nr:leucine-rich repeat domain-containing protein [Lachnospiraceae bacterium]
MREVSLKTAGGELIFEVTQQEAHLARTAGPVSAPEVPDLVEGMRVTAVSRKAFLGKKTLRRITLPETVTRIGDWAFAGCDRLREITLPRAELEKSVFLGCTALRTVRIPGREGALSEEDTAALLAAAAPRPEGAYLMDLQEAGSAAWLRKWDAWTAAFLRESDQEGYAKQILCGEEDYGSTDLAAFESRRRQEKAERCMLRLMHDGGLTPEFRQSLTSYVTDHIPGAGEHGGESWLAVVGLHPAEPEWIRLFDSLGGITAANVGDLLQSVPEEYPELRAYLMKSRSSGADSFFAGLAL